MAESTGGQLSSRLLSMRSASALLELPKVRDAAHLQQQLTLDCRAHRSEICQGGFIDVGAKIMNTAFASKPVLAAHRRLACSPRAPLCQRCSSAISRWFQSPRRCPSRQRQHE